MSENDGKKTLGVRSGPRASNVKQSFSHGRSKNVVVETKRKRVVVPKAGTSKTSIQSSNRDGTKGLASGITDTEMERRLKALQAAKAREADEVAQREASAKEREQAVHAKLARRLRELLHGRRARRAAARGVRERAARARLDEAEAERPVRGEDRGEHGRRGRGRARSRHREGGFRPDGDFGAV